MHPARLGLPARCLPIDRARARRLLGHLLSLVARGARGRVLLEQAATLGSLLHAGDHAGFDARLATAPPPRLRDLERHRARLHQLGHHAPGTLIWRGHAAYGPDRLHRIRLALEETLSGRLDGPAFRFPAEQWPHPSVFRGPATTPVTCYLSVRSPYSYLVFGRFLDLCAARGWPYRIRPVLPLAMRGVAIPRSRALALLADAAREARDLAIPFGRIADPLGRGVERALAVWAALDEERSEPFEAPGQPTAATRWLLACMRGCWSQGIDLATDSGLRQIADQQGVSPALLRDALATDNWRTPVQYHQAALLADGGGCGVPFFVRGSGPDAVRVWGQDRLWALAGG